MADEEEWDDEEEEEEEDDGSSSTTVTDHKTTLSVLSSVVKSKDEKERSKEHGTFSSSCWLSHFARPFFHSGHVDRCRWCLISPSPSL